MLKHESILHSFLLPNNIPLYECNPVYLSIYQLMYIWAVLTFCFYEYLCTSFCVNNMFLILLDIPGGVGLLGHMVTNSVFKSLRNCQTIKYLFLHRVSIFLSEGLLPLPCVAK